MIFAPIFIKVLSTVLGPNQLPSTFEKPCLAHSAKG